MSGDGANVVKMWRGRGEMLGRQGFCCTGCGAVSLVRRRLCARCGAGAATERTGLSGGEVRAVTAGPLGGEPRSGDGAQSRGMDRVIGRRRPSGLPAPALRFAEPPAAPAGRARSSLRAPRAARASAPWRTDSLRAQGRARPSDAARAQTQTRDDDGAKDAEQVTSRGDSSRCRTRSCPARRSRPGSSRC
jgi:hypothetical protein